ncbi:hypothetical protein [Noviherbaspirillum sp. Root189]|uniref:hypothetical protein n=1 Tax=Noviherbaspirillum sp. Root189 TaxID=1736487 RepID=UPI000ADDE46B|nr:hypothetical protein [Noviherbaspirillum sp. Root189]
MQDHDPEMREILEMMLATDQAITARAVARLHPSITAASSITRNQARSQLLAQYQERQTEYRRWRGRVGKQSGVDAAAALEQKEHRIVELEHNMQLLIASHLAMLRAVGAIGGFNKWAQFYEQYRDVREKLAALGAMPDTTVSTMQAEKYPNQRADTKRR